MRDCCTPSVLAAAPLPAVLIIDRDFATRLAARRVLELAGFTVSTAGSDGYLPRGSFDLVVADLSQISRGYLERRYPRVRILGVPSDGTGELTKPFTPSQLLTAVRRALARR